ncbi:MAG: hypothetical protein ACXW3F_12085 [Pyrinomonadaceae bacterium]
MDQFRKVLELDPNYLIARSFLAEAYEQKGDFISNSWAAGLLVSRSLRSNPRFQDVLKKVGFPAM